jgi:hypothetical protein
MRDGEPQRDFLGRLVAWAGQHDLIRASLLTSTRATNPAAVDLLSDYDVILYVTDIAPFGDRDHWLPALGTVLVRMSPIEARVFDELPGYSEGVIYDDGTKADFTIVHVELLRRIVVTSQLPAELDHGYRVLLDKDGIAAHLPPPTFRAYLPPKRAAQRYQDVVEEFWWETTYVAKYLWREAEPLAARQATARASRARSQRSARDRPGNPNDDGDGGCRSEPRGRRGHGGLQAPRASEPVQGRGPMILAHSATHWSRIATAAAAWPATSCCTSARGLAQKEQLTGYVRVRSAHTTPTPASIASGTLPVRAAVSTVTTAANVSARLLASTVGARRATSIVPGKWRSPAARRGDGRTRARSHSPLALVA